jgi:hypothetical protein
MALYNFRAPALPLSPIEYDQRQQDQLLYALRLYFNRLDQFNNTSSTVQNSQNVLMWLGGPGGC